MSVLSGPMNFASLSLKDLLAARDAYHWHLMNKDNVVGTAVGLYLIRKADIPEHAPRTFENSEVRPNSWPCILVLVSEWKASTEFGGDGGIDPTHMTSKTLYLADGRAAPVCVVSVQPGTPADAAPATVKWPESYVASDWTSQPFGIEGVLGSVADLNEANLGTQLIDNPVEAFGAASGHLTGKIKALFYRHKAMAGYDYVSEFLIAPDDGRAQTCPGDSGTVWHLIEADPDPKKRVLRPIALEWGGQALVGASDKRFNFSLASGLSTVCELLDIDLVRTADTGPTPFWGQTGHYSIATAAIETVANQPLRDFLKANLARISFRPDELTPDQIRQRLSQGDFVELADLPDLVWKKVKGQIPGGRDYHQNAGPEHPNHYADADKPDAGSGPTLREMVMNDAAKMTVQDWQAWYAANGETDKAHLGLLPFRVWQLFKVMVDALQAANGPDLPTFLCAAGVVSHYIGDACQPLHGSYLSNGYQDRPVPTTGKNPKWAGEGVHSAYEDKMVDAFSARLLSMITPAAQAFAATNPGIPAMPDGQGAAVATIHLMDYCANVLKPADLCDTYIQLGGGSSKRTITGLWDAFKDQTAEVMGAGACYLAATWEAAYTAGGSPPLGDAVIPEATLAAIYQDETFAPSKTLDAIGPYL